TAELDIHAARVAADADVCIGQAAVTPGDLEAYRPFDALAQITATGRSAVARDADVLAITAHARLRREREADHRIRRSAVDTLRERLSGHRRRRHEQRHGRKNQSSHGMPPLSR